jgi:outer membrane biosynthesis protein TonB
MPRQANFSPPKEAAAKVAEPPAPVDLTGVTLTGDDGSGWSSMTGNGQSMAAPIRSAVIAPPQTKKSEKDSDGAVLGNSGPKIDVVALRDLAAKPSPPALNSKLLANYPQGAKRQGIAGKASILARIDADGVVRQARTLAESSEGFGAACRKTLLGSVWSPPRDRSGRAVSTQIHYTCDFRVDD